jgi:hypothetical protein
MGLATTVDMFWGTIELPELWTGDLLRIGISMSFDS